MNQSRDSNLVRRPSPFGPASALLPEDHQLIHVGERTSVADALRIMIDNNFSQLSVVDGANHVTGIFSFRALSSRVLDLKDANIDLATLLVSECLEKPKYISPNDYIDTTKAADFREDDYVIIGTPTDVKGVLTVADVFIRLNDFAEAFVLLYETEDGLRELIPRVLDAAALATTLEQINLRSKGSGRGGKPIKTVEDCDFSHYIDLVTSKGNWTHFEAVFPFSSRELVNKELRNANALRNDVFHFRRQITRADTGMLRHFREKVDSALRLVK